MHSINVSTKDRNIKIVFVPLYFVSYLIDNFAMSFSLIILQHIFGFDLCFKPNLIWTCKKIILDSFLTIETSKITDYPINLISKILYLHQRTVRFLKRRGGEKNQIRKEKRNMRRITLYHITKCFCFVFLSINHVYAMFFQDKDVYKKEEFMLHQNGVNLLESSNEMMSTKNNGDKL